MDPSNNGSVEQPLIHQSIVFIINRSLKSIQSNNIAPSTLRRRRLKSKVPLWRIKCFLSTLRLRNNHRSFWFLLNIKPAFLDSRVWRAYSKNNSRNLRNIAVFSNFPSVVWMLLNRILTTEVCKLPPLLTLFYYLLTFSQPRLWPLGCQRCS